MTRLSVNVNKVALLRNSRSIGIPNIIKAAKICIKAGAHGITVHPRPDERHIRRLDVHELAEMLTVEFNIEGNPVPEFLKLVREVQPAQCTLVPDAPDAVTSDHGWDLVTHGDFLRPIVRELKDLGLRVSLFMDPELDQIERAKEVGADRIELYTEPYATAFREGDLESVFQKYRNAVKKAGEVGLGINAGHDLNLQNLSRFCSLPNVLEVSIGHALISDALEIGLSQTVKMYLAVLSQY